MKIKYSPDAADRLRKIKKESGTRIACKITKAIRGLEEVELVDADGNHRILKIDI